MEKNKRIEEANDTLRIFSEGIYFKNGKQVKVGGFHETSIAMAKLIEENSPIFNKNICKKFVKPAEVCVWNKPVVDIVIESNERIGVLNFASAYNPGGGFLKGSMAQEESLCYASNLYYIQKEFTNEFYKYNKTLKTKCYSNRMIFSEKIVFVKNSSFNLLDKPVYADILTVPAVNIGAALKNGEDESKCNEIMKDRMRNILKVLLCYGEETIVLGAFGCGVFGNHPKKIAKYWKELLDEGWLYKFKKIIFAVYDTSPSQSTYHIFRTKIKSGK